MYRFNIDPNMHFGDCYQFKYNPCIGSIITFFIDFFSPFGFKYNPCIGSITKTNFLNFFASYLNTTHVSVQSKELTVKVAINTNI